jgi:hypothetical protein
MGPKRTLYSVAIPFLYNDLRDTAIIQKSYGDTNPGRNHTVLCMHRVHETKNGKNCSKELDLSDQKGFEMSIKRKHRSTVRKTGSGILTFKVNTKLIRPENE